MLMASSLAIGLLGPAAAFATDDPAPADRTEADENVRIAFWNGRQSEAIPRAVTSSFPPEAACLVAAQLCSFPSGDLDPTAAIDPTGGAGVTLVPDDDPSSEPQPEPGLGAFGNAFLDAINAQYTTGFEAVQSNDPGLTAEPVPENTLPASVAFGQEYYRSAIEFPLPVVPAGDVADSFIVVFAQGNPTFSNSSPALRQAVLATLTCAQVNESGAVGGRCQQEEFEKIVTKSCSEDSAVGPCLREDSPLVIQACPIGKDLLSGDDNPAWSEGGPQSETTLPSVNCIAGGLGQSFVEGETTFWAFDLTSAFRSWEDGSMPYEGLLMSPGAADNFAFGDSETTFNKQLTLSADPEYVLVTSLAPPPFVAPDFGDQTSVLSGGFENSSTTTTTTTGGFVSPPQPAANSPLSVPAPQPAVADPGVTDTPAVAPNPSADVALDGAAAPIPVRSDLYLLWLLPLFMLGAWLLSTSFSEEVAVAAGRAGAMTRLLERRAIANAPDLISS
jgi:hypothetical protein